MQLHGLWEDLVSADIFFLFVNKNREDLKYKIHLNLHLN